MLLKITSLYIDILHLWAHIDNLFVLIVFSLFGVVGCTPSQQAATDSRIACCFCTYGIIQSDYRATERSG